MLAGLLAACSGREKASIGELERAFKVSRPPQASESGLAVAPAHGGASGAEADTRRLVAQSMAALQSHNYNAAVTNLEMLQQRRTLAPEQRLAVQNAIASAQRELALAASRGDADALRKADQLRQAARH